MKAIHWKVNSHTAVFPKKGSKGAAGYDFSADLGLGGEKTLYPGEHLLIPTGISVIIPAGYYMRIAPRSGLALKHCIDVMAGVIDHDYRGEIGVILINHYNTKFVIKHGERIAQGIITKIADDDFYDEQHGVNDSLTGTDRGSGGFGSTGV